MNRWCDFPKGANPRVTMEGGNRHPAMRRGYQGTTEKAGQGPGWGGGSASSSSPPHNSPNTSSFLCLLFGTKDLKRVVPTRFSHVFTVHSLLSLHQDAFSHIRHQNGSWQSFGDLRLSADTSPPSLPYTSFSIREGPPLLVS